MQLSLSDESIYKLILAGLKWLSLGKSQKSIADRGESTGKGPVVGRSFERSAFRQTSMAET